MTSLHRTLAVMLSGIALAACTDEVAFDLDGGDYAQLGSAYVDRRDCARCHEPTDGAGRLAGRLQALPMTEAYPRNLSTDVETGIGGWADVAIVRAMRFGVDDKGDPLCPPMPRFADMSDLEARAIVAYLRSLPAVHHAVPDSRCPPIKPPFVSADLGVAHD